MRDISCPFCSASRIRMFFSEMELAMSGYRCLNCGCKFMILKKGVIPEPEPAYYDDDDDRDDHASNCWPNNSRR